MGWVWAGSPSDGICYQGQWAAGQHPGYPSPLLPAYSRMGETVEVGVQLGAGARGGGSRVRSWAEAGDRWGVPMCSHLCPVTASKQSGLRTYIGVGVTG